MTTPEATVSGSVRDNDVAQLHALGYAQELRRRMGGFSNFAVSFTIISVLSGCLTLYYFGMTYGGPVDIVWGWVIVGVMTTIVGLGMAEIASAYPTAGGLYYWSAKLSKNNPGAWSWFTGWFNLLGQVAITAGIDYGFATFFTVFLNLTTGYKDTAGYVLIIYAGILIVHGILNTFGVRIVSFLSDVSAWWHVLGVLTIAIVLFFVPSHHASASFIFTKFENKSTLGVPIYVFMLGLLMAQYTFTGYDASAHMSEETRNADLAAPRGIVSSIVVSLIAGWILILAITSVIPTHPAVYAATAADTAAPVAIWEVALSRLGAELLLLIAVIAQAFCGMASVTANSAHAVRLQPRRGRAGAQVLAPHQPAHEDAHELDLVLRGLRLHPRRPLALERCGLRRSDLDRHHRPLHRLCAADPVATLAGEELARRPLVVGEVEPTGGLGRDHLGGLHCGPLHAPGGVLLEHQPGQLQLRPDRRGRRPGVFRRLLVAQRTQVVHRAEGAGHGGRAQGD